MNVIAYVVSTNIRSQFLKAQLIQRSLFPTAIFGLKQIVVSDGPWSADSFGISRSQVVKSDLWVGGEFRISKSRNVCIEQAVALGAEWLILFDADGVLIRPITVWPSTGLGNVKGRTQMRGETISQSLQFFKEPVIGDFDTMDKMNARGLNPGWFVLHRRVFLKHRFDESYVGWGNQDQDYPDTLKANGIIHSDCNACAIHLWHSPRNQSRARINEQKFITRPK